MTLRANPAVSPSGADAWCPRSMQRQSWGERPAARQNCVRHGDGWGVVTDGSIGGRTTCQKSHDSQQVRLNDSFNMFSVLKIGSIKT